MQFIRAIYWIKQGKKGSIKISHIDNVEFKLQQITNEVAHLRKFYKKKENNMKSYCIIIQIDINMVDGNICMSKILPLQMKNMFIFSTTDERGQKSYQNKLHWF